MLESQILMVAAATDQPIVVAPPSSVTLSSADAGWPGLVLEQQHLPPVETPEIYMSEHFLGVMLSPPKVLTCDDETGRLERELRPGDVLFRGAGAPGRYRWDTPAEVLDVSLAPAVVERVAQEAFDLDHVEPVVTAGGPDPQTLYLALALRAELAAGGPGGRVYVESLLTALAVRVLRGYARPPSRSVRVEAVTGLSRTQRQRVLAHIRGHLQEDLSLSALAAVVHLSPYHFARMFRAAVGVPPHRYVTGQRVAEARRLLASGRYTVEQVARRVGFASASHLARHFRRTVGAPPSAFLPQARKNGR
jgi:AraC family transcriptional regulator